MKVCGLGVELVLHGCSGYAETSLKLLLERFCCAMFTKGHT